MVGYAMRYEVTSLGTGQGKPIFAWSLGGVRYYICRDQFYSGVTFTFPNVVKPTRGARLLVYSGGIIANFATACLLCFILYFNPDNMIWWIGLGTACLCLSWSIIPWRNLQNAFSSQNDGANIVDILWPRKSSDELVTPETLSRYLAILKFLQGVGDYKGLYFYATSLLPAFLYYTEGEDAKWVLSCLASLEQIENKHQFEHALLRAHIGLAEDDLANTEEALDEAERLYTENHEEYYGLTLQWLRFSWLLKAKRPADALKIVDMMIALHPIEENAETAVTLLTCRLHAVLDLHGLDGGLKVYEEYLQKRSFYETDALDLNVAHALAKAYGKADEWQAAERHYREALALATKMGSLPHADRELIDDAQVCFAHLELTNDFELAQAKEALNRSIKEKRVAEKRQAHLIFLQRRNAEMAFGCICVSLLIFVVARQDGEGVDFGSYLSTFSLVAAFMIVPIYLYGGFDRGFRPFVAPIILLLTVLPWLAAFLVIHSV
ncbi:hypothetical protein CCAX7_008440 [Capsulimonas corticalis]|uniref:Uncharacterized protein n=1 Tax=Capsulimonas corticalis TaxID=2219043 RepID=A0A402CTY3_9BACT|nr:hypothetical protein CCAX7_008440 [Capsulimonas corticalis]